MPRIEIQKSDIEKYIEECNKNFPTEFIEQVMNNTQTLEIELNKKSILKNIVSIFKYLKRRKDNE